MRQVMWQKGGIASTHMTEMHAYGYSLKDTTRYASGGLNFRSASRLVLSTLCDPFCGRKTTNYEFIHSKPSHYYTTNVPLGSVYSSDWCSAPVMPTLLRLRLAID